jgi:hypothetical protein
MWSRRLRLALPLLVVALAGCGQSGASNSLSLAQLPLVKGASIVTQLRQCDLGANAFCAIVAVVADPHAGSAGALVTSEHRYLRKLGWTMGAGDDGDEHAAESRGHKLRVTYATAKDDLTGIDLGWIKRPRALTLTLVRELFDRTPAMSIMLEAGPR